MPKQQSLSQQQQQSQQQLSFNWTQSLYLKSNKNHSFTMSQLTKNQFDYQNYFQSNHQNSHQHQYQHAYEYNHKKFNQINQKLNQKNKNKINSKNFRQRKKNQQHALINKLKYLQTQNHKLKQQKYCKYCKKYYNTLIEVIENNDNLKEKQKEKENHSSKKIIITDKITQNNNNNNQKYYQCNNVNTVNQKDNHHKEGLQFQMFKIDKLHQNHNKNKVNKQKSGKIWIALGILMLVLGIHLYGFRGEQGYHGISISKIQSKKVIETFKSSSNSNIQNDYFNVKIKVKDKQFGKSSKSQQLHSKQQGIFKQIRIFHQQQQQLKSKSYYNNNKKQYQSHHHNQMIDESNQYNKHNKHHDNHKSYNNQNNNKKFTQINFDMLNKQNNYNLNQNQYQNQDQYDEVKFHKELLWAIQAEIDDLGRYV